MSPEYRRQWLCLGAVWLIIGAGLTWVQFSIPGFNSIDASFHVGMAKVIPEQGITREFQWTQHSVWKESFADRSLLFHLLMIPFCLGDVPSSVQGAKIFILLPGIAIFVLMGLTLRALKVPLPWLWCLALFVASPSWLNRISMVRPFVLSIALILAGLWALAKDRWKTLLALGFVFSWTYSAPHLLIAVAVVMLLCRRVREGTWAWKPLAAAAGGVVAGLILHPYFPNTFVVWWIQNPMVLLHNWGIAPVEAGTASELRSPPAEWWIANSGVVILFAAVNLLAWIRRSDLQGATLTALVLAWITFLFTAVSYRIVEYFAPMVVLSLGLTFRDAMPWLRTLQLPDWARNAHPKKVATLLTLLLLCSWGFWSVLEAPRRAMPYGPWTAGAAAWMKENLPGDEKILHLAFSHFPDLFLHDRDRRYLVGLDAMFGAWSHPEETKFIRELWQLPRTPPFAEIDPQMIAARLQGRYLYVDGPAWGKFYGRQLMVKGARPVYVDPVCAIFDLTPGK